MTLQNGSGPVWSGIRLLYSFRKELLPSQELRHGVRRTGTLAGAADILNNIPLDQFFTALATRLNCARANGKEITVNFVFKDVGATIVVRLENSVLHHKETEEDPHADATLTLTRPFWIKLVTRQASIKDLVFSDDLHVKGNRMKLLSLFSLFDDPDGNFPIVTP